MRVLRAQATLALGVALLWSAPAHAGGTHIHPVSIRINGQQIFAEEYSSQEKVVVAPGSQPGDRHQFLRAACPARGLAPGTNIQLVLPRGLRLLTASVFAMGKASSHCQPGFAEPLAILARNVAGEMAGGPPSLTRPRATGRKITPSMILRLASVAASSFR